MGDFVGNRAHSTHSGLFIDRGQINNEGEVEDQTSYHPRSFEKQLPFLTDQKTIEEENFPRAEFGIPVPALVLDFTAFKCLAFGIWGRGDRIQIVHAKLADNLVGVSLPEAANVVQDSVFVGETKYFFLLNLPQNLIYNLVTLGIINFVRLENLGALSIGQMKKEGTIPSNFG